MSNQSYYVKNYKAHEKAGNWAQAAAWRNLAAHTHGNPNNGHAQYQHYCRQQAYDQKPFNAIGQTLGGVGPNPFQGNNPKAPASAAFQQYTIGPNGGLYLGGKPYN